MSFMLLFCEVVDYMQSLVHTKHYPQHKARVWRDKQNRNKSPLGNTDEKEKTSRKQKMKSRIAYKYKDSKNTFFKF